MKLFRLKRIAAIFAVQTLFYMFAFKIFWNFNLFDFSHWKLLFSYVSQGYPVSLIFLFLIFSYPFIFIINYLIISALNYTPLRIEPVKKVEVNNVFSYTDNDNEIPQPVLNIDVGFIPEYDLNNQQEVQIKVEQISTTDVQKDKLLIENMLKKLEFDLLENIEKDNFKTDWFCIADRLVLFSAYFNNENVLIDESGENPCSWLDNGVIIPSPLYKLYLIKNAFQIQANDVLEDVKVDFTGTLFLSITPSNLDEINLKAESLNLKIICLDNLPKTSDAFINSDIDINPNEDEYFKKFIQSVANFIDPNFEYDDSADEFLDEIDEDKNE